jgi:hypothetical protein
MGINHTVNAGWQGQNGSTVPASYSLSGSVETNASESLTAGAGGQGVPFNWPHSASGVLLWIKSDQNCWMSVNQAAPYVFTCSSANATVGSTYTNNGQTFTVLATIAAGLTLLCSGTGAPSASGTLTKATGTGDATITFSAESAAILAVALQANQPYIWHNQMYTSNPLSADCTELYFSNTAMANPNLVIRSLHN